MYKVNDKLKRSVAELCREFQVRQLLLFGSAARKDFRARGSDIDLLVEFEPSARIGLLRFSELQERFEDLFHRKVDLVPKEGLKPLVRDRVLADAVPIYSNGH